MPIGSDAISGVPVGAILGTAGLAAAVWRLRRDRALTAPRLLVGVALAVYVAAIVAHSAFPISLSSTDGGVPWTAYLNLVPLRGTELADAVQNVAVFAPLGILLPLVLPVRTVVGLTAAAVAVSSSIELLQLVNALTGHGGHIADVNDLLANVAGAWVGYAVLRLAVVLPTSRRLVVPFAWPSAGPVVGRRDPSAVAAAPTHADA